MTPFTQCPAFLASVTSPAEAEQACAAGADIIDAKNPDAGALGALPVPTVAAIRAALPAHIPLSATIGDLPLHPDTICAAVRAMAASGCEVIKIGFFPGGAAHETLAALAKLSLGHVKLAGLLLADQAPDFALIGAMADARFAGVMLDTAVKSSGRLTTHMDAQRLAGFIASAHDVNLFAGLAGSLRLSDIRALAELGPDVLGFRGALCEAAVRAGPLVAAQAGAVRRALDRAVAGRSGGRGAKFALV